MFFVLFALVETVPKEKFAEYDGIFKKHYDKETMTVESSTTWLNRPSDIIDPNSYYEFCTKYRKDKQWISIHFNKQSVSVTSYSLQLGCCYFYDSCCCDLYSWELEGSNDNETWCLIDKREKIDDFTYCQSRDFKIKHKQRPYSYIRLTQTSPKPGCQYCIGLLRMELYGDISDGMRPILEDDSFEDEVSIIGHIKHE